MKIEKTSSCNYLARPSNNTKYNDKQAIEASFGKTIYRNYERLHHCSIHPEDLDIDYVQKSTILYLRYGYSIPDDELTNMQTDLHEHILPALLQKKFEMIREEDKLVETYMHNINWSLIDEYEFTMDYYHDEMNILSILSKRSKVKRSSILCFIPLLFYILTDLLYSINSIHNKPIKIEMQTLLPYLKFELLINMRTAYIMSEHILDKILPEYTEHLIKKASTYTDVKIELNDSNAVIDSD